MAATPDVSNPSTSTIENPTSSDPAVEDPLANKSVQGQKPEYPLAGKDFRNLSESDKDHFLRLLRARLGSDKDRVWPKGDTMKHHVESRNAWLQALETMNEFGFSGQSSTGGFVVPKQESISTFNS